MMGLNNMIFTMGDPNPQRGRMTFDVTLPSVSASRGSHLELVGVAPVSPGLRRQREVMIKLRPGQPFARIRWRRQPTGTCGSLCFYDNLIRLITFRLDPSSRTPGTPAHPQRLLCITPDTSPTAWASSRISVRFA